MPSWELGRLVFGACLIIVILLLLALVLAACAFNPPAMVAPADTTAEAQHRDRYECWRDANQATQSGLSATHERSGVVQHRTSFVQVLALWERERLHRDCMKARGYTDEQN